jgi:hypothetical protein
VPQWLTPVILATQEAEIRRIKVQSQPEQVVHKTLSQKNPSQKRAGGVAQGVGLEFKPHYQKKQTNKQKFQHYYRIGKIVETYADRPKMLELTVRYFKQV